MKIYQDTDTGEIYAFDDHIDPLNLSNTPKTLSDKVIQKPNDSFVWFKGNWVNKAEIPSDFKPPIKTAKNHAWGIFLKPYTHIHNNEADKLTITLDQINSNLYPANEFAKAVYKLPHHTNSKHFENIDALVTSDGLIALPQNKDYCSTSQALEQFNIILSAILLGGIHVGVANNSDLVSAQLQDSMEIFVFNSSLSTRLRSREASHSERIILIQKRTLCSKDLEDAYLYGISIINRIYNFSPYFMLHGYTAMHNQNLSEALSNFWVVVEQLISFLWKKKVLDSAEFHPSIKIIGRLDSLNDNRTYSTSVKLELLWQLRLISENALDALSRARKQRNNLVHEGAIPDFDVVKNVWDIINELLESITSIKEIKMRQLPPFIANKLEISEHYNFDLWQELSKTMVHTKK